MSNPNILFISEEKIKSYTNLNTNISPAELTPYILDAQNILMPNLLGGTYYEALKGRIDAGTLTTADEYLLDNYIGQILCNAAFGYASTFLAYRPYNKNILKGTSENGEPVSLDELKFLQSQLKMIWESYAQQMVLYLNTHLQDYPEYVNPKLEDGQYPDKMTPYTTNIVMPHMPYARDQRIARSLRDGRNGYGWGYWGWDAPNTGN